MKKLVNIIKFLGLISLIIFLYAFSAKRNAARPIKKIHVKFVGETRPFINETMVNKLLIQNQGRATNVGKETLALNSIEDRLMSEDVIAKVDVYRSVNAILTTKIQQRTPIARVNAATPFYIDEEGVTMSLSENYTARVPMVYNVQKDDVAEIHQLLQEVLQDDFLKHYVVAITKIGVNDYTLAVREHDFGIRFGGVKNSKKKIKNFKAFYQNALKDQSLGSYKSVNLRYSNQVVCIRKEVKN